jgi:uncharacterized protein involved in exopolysaccharide biosynthesis
MTLVRRRWKVIAGATLASALLALVFAATTHKTYEANTELLVGPVNGDYGTLQAAGQLGRTYAELAKSNRLVQTAARSAGLTVSNDEAKKAVAATSNEITRIVEVRVRAGDAKAAARMANAVAGGLLALRRRLPPQDSEPVDELLREAELVRLTSGERAGVRRAAERVLGRTNAGALEVINRAEPPAGPVSPRVGLIVLLGALAGALAALAFFIFTEAGERESAFDDLEFADLLDDYNGPEIVPGGSPVDEWLNSTAREKSS